MESHSFALRVTLLRTTHSCMKTVSIDILTPPWSQSTKQAEWPLG